jgi:hypothetical protein
MALSVVAGCEAYCAQGCLEIPQACRQHMQGQSSCKLQRIEVAENLSTDAAMNDLNPRQHILDRPRRLARYL